MTPAAADPPGLLVLCGTPIGNVGDATPRLAEMLTSADVIAAEDTRRLIRLARHLGIRTAPLVSFFEANEVGRTAELLAALIAGRTVALVTDAGMPSVSDPGYRLVAAAVAAGIRVSVVPGASAVTAALAVSGLPTDRWCMEGFLPRQGGPRRARLAELAAEPRTLVLFEAPHRLAASLADLAAAFGGQRPGVVCRELTKTWEEIRRGSLAELAEWAAEGVRGEITLVVGGAPSGAEGTTGRSPVELAAAVAEREDVGETRKEAIAAVAAATGVSKRAVFDAVVAAKRLRFDGPVSTGGPAAAGGVTESGIR
ncbi:MAG TPA: 16S rRNA (cytidine(1402)-2'-O)-methyltransferase [Mycobacteriales bacterium]|nr:16S rRNA (cytidine(1402)-2'-O)-methyltransferase [Mycobacteriales bacterium]